MKMPEPVGGFIFDCDHGYSQVATNYMSDSDVVKLYTADALRDVLEQAASVVENANTPDCGGWTAQGIADAIRAMKEQIK